MTPPDEPCREHTLPPHHRIDTGPGDCPPLFRFWIHWRLMPVGVPMRREFWAPGPESAYRTALAYLVGRYGPSGVVADSVSLGPPKRAKRAPCARVGLFDPKEPKP